tara:strand:+ start:1763 stop:2341 length:579 start_codon:yes stop_codon:yes gene_type:complete
MRHGISGRKLNRSTSHRKALFKNLSNSLITNEQIMTTLVKAKELRPFIEKLITIGKKNTLHSRRKIFSVLRDQNNVKKICEVLSQRYLKRPGGYTRIIKAGYRYGDASPMAVIEFLNRDKNAKGKQDKDRLNTEKISEKEQQVKTESTSNKNTPISNEVKAKNNKQVTAENASEKDMSKEKQGKAKKSEEEK